MDETAVHCDLILPDHTCLEGWGYHVPAVGDRPVISGQQPVMRPLYDTRATADVFLSMARDLGGLDAMALTHTCYNGERPPCGQCPACELRAKGFAEAGIEDPLLTA